MDEWKWVDTGFACGGLEVKGNRIIAAPPIWRGWVGRAYSSFIAYYHAKEQTNE